MRWGASGGFGLPRVRRSRSSQFFPPSFLHLALTLTLVSAQHPSLFSQVLPPSIFLPSLAWSRSRLAASGWTAWVVTYFFPRASCLLHEVGLCCLRSRQVSINNQNHDGEKSHDDNPASQRRLKASGCVAGVVALFLPQSLDAICLWSGRGPGHTPSPREHTSHGGKKTPRWCPAHPAGRKTRPD